MPNRNRRPVVAGLLVILVLLVIGGYLAWDQILRGDDVAPIGFTDPSGSPAAATDSSVAPRPPGSAGSTASTAANAGSTSASGLAGTWTVGSDSVVGYRVREQLGGVSAVTDAVGRTSSVTGEATIEPSGSSLRVTKASFEADLTTLKSDRTMRDNRIRTMGLESATYPKATFVLTEPVDVPAAALTGSTVDVTLSGDLTIHGVTKRVAIPAQARLANGRVEVTGSLTFPFADFGMTPPNVAGFVSVQDDATLEFLAALDRAAA